MSEASTTQTSMTIGIDLGDRKSHLCVLDADGAIEEEVFQAARSWQAPGKPS